MGQMIFTIIGAILACIGDICIYDARTITKKMFSFGDQNEGAMGLKIFGFLFAVAGALVVFFNIG